MPPFDGIGANEYIVDVVHDVCDFISAVDTPAIWELNIWYHTLNCGYRAGSAARPTSPASTASASAWAASTSSSTPDEPLDFDAWVEGIKDGRSYCCDGLSHLIDFRVNDESGRIEPNGKIVASGRTGGPTGQAEPDQARPPPAK